MVNMTIWVAQNIAKAFIYQFNSLLKSHLFLWFCLENIFTPGLGCHLGPQINQKLGISIALKNLNMKLKMLTTSWPVLKIGQKAKETYTVQSRRIFVWFWAYINDDDPWTSAWRFMSSFVFCLLKNTITQLLSRDYMNVT